MRTHLDPPMTPCDLGSALGLATSCYLQLDFDDFFTVAPMSGVFLAYVRMTLKSTFIGHITQKSNAAPLTSKTHTHEHHRRRSGGANFDSIDLQNLHF